MDVKLLAAIAAVVVMKKRRGGGVVKSFMCSKFGTVSCYKRTDLRAVVWGVLV